MHEIKVLEFLKERELSSEYHRIDQIYGEMDFGGKTRNAEFLKRSGYLDYVTGDGVINFAESGLDLSSGHYVDLYNKSKKGDLSIWAIIKPAGSEYLRSERDKTQQIETNIKTAKSSKRANLIAWMALVSTVIYNIYGYYRDDLKKDEIDSINQKLVKTDSVYTSVQTRISQLEDSLTSLRTIEYSKKVNP